ncbi:MAG: carboxymuconolactone decarboxylase family protein [Pseudomonadota bacterium]
MSVYPSLPIPAHLEHLFQAFPKGAKPLLALHDALLREDSAFSIAERELIAAYVSGLNACTFCFGAHRAMAMAFGIPAQTVDALIADIDTAPIDDRMRPVLAYAAKVTRLEGVTQDDARAVFAAGWPDHALHDTVMITALYNFMNRLVEGSGLAAKEAHLAPTEADLSERRSGTYVGWGEASGFIPAEGRS